MNALIRDIKNGMLYWWIDLKLGLQLYKEGITEWISKAFDKRQN